MEQMDLNNSHAFNTIDTFILEEYMAEMFSPEEAKKVRKIKQILPTFNYSVSSRPFTPEILKAIEEFIKDIE